MTKVIDITEQLNFEDNPQLKIKDVIVSVDSSATTMLKMMQLIGNNSDNITPKTLLEMYDLLFSEEDRQKIDALKLSAKNLMVLIQQAVSLVIGEDSGE